MPATATVRFSDLPDDMRMRLRDVIYNAGGDIAGYVDDAVQVAVPADVGAFMAKCRAAGLSRQGDGHYFPLGSDNPPAGMRHDGRYPGSKGFWLYYNLIFNG